IPAATNCAPPDCSASAVFRSTVKPNDSASILTHYRSRARAWMMESKSVSKCEDGIVARVVYSRLFPDWAKPQTGRLNKSPHTVRTFASRRKKEKQYKERKRPLTLREARFEWFRSLAFPVVFFLFSLPPVTGRPVKTHAEIKVTAKVELLNSRVKARNG